MTSRLPRIAGHGRVVGAKRRLADRQRPLILLSRTFQARQAVGMDAPEPTAGHPRGHPPGQPSKMDTLLGRLDGASGHQGGRPPRPTAWPDAFLGSSAVVHPCGCPGSTNDERLSPPWAAVRPGIRAGVRPSRAGASIPTAMVRVIVKRLARQSPSRPCERPAWPHDVIRRFLGGASGRDGNGCGREWPHDPVVECRVAAPDERARVTRLPGCRVDP